MAGAGNFKRILQILERWPIDENKAGRDLGTYLRNQFKKAHSEGKFENNFEYWDRQYFSLKKLVENEHFNKYPRALASSATGLTAEQCNMVLSNDFLEYLEKEEQSFVKKLFMPKRKN